MANEHGWKVIKEFDCTASIGGKDLDGTVTIKENNFGTRISVFKSFDGTYELTISSEMDTKFAQEQGVIIP